MEEEEEEQLEEEEEGEEEGEEGEEEQWQRERVRRRFTAHTRAERQMRRCIRMRYSGCLLYWYNSTNTDRVGGGRREDSGLVFGPL